MACQAQIQDRPGQTQRSCRFCSQDTSQLYAGTFQFEDDDRIALFGIPICEICWRQYGGQEDLSQILVSEIVRQSSRPEIVI